MTVSVDRQYRPETRKQFAPWDAKGGYGGKEGRGPPCSLEAEALRSDPQQVPSQHYLALKLLLNFDFPNPFLPQQVIAVCSGGWGWRNTMRDIPGETAEKLVFGGTLLDANTPPHSFYLN